ncbi:MAG: hypothetical protein NDJ72_05670 [Elusimicrobia bacterium]|nr:hypothetical protein [Elusimicrobiota bacterium]
MRALLFLALFVAPSAHAAVAAAPELVALEKELAEGKEALKRGEREVPAFEAFVADFRPRMEEAVERAPKTRENVALHARILVLLDDHDAAISTLGRALEIDPGDETLTMTLGQTLLERGDYASALAEAEKVLARDPKHGGALLLKHTAAGRSAGKAPSAAPTETASSYVATQHGGSRQAVAFTEHPRKKGTSEVPGLSSGGSAPIDDKGMPLWPLAVPIGAGLIGYGVYRSKQTVTGEGFDPDPTLTEEQMAENRRQGYKVGGAMLAVGLTAGVAWYTGPAILNGLRAIPTLIAPFGQKVADSANRVGQSATQVAASEFGAILPETQAIIIRAKTLYNANQAVIDPRKFTAYALNPQHAQGGSDKARVFRSVLGYTKDNYEGLLAQIKQGILTAPATTGQVNEHGIRKVVDILVQGPAGSAVVRTAWIYDSGTTVPRLVSVYVK